MWTATALYYSTAVEIRKYDENGKQSTENREQRIQLQRLLLPPVDRRGERANKLINVEQIGIFIQ